MLTSSNFMLTTLAICDLITMLSYVPYALQFYCLYRLDLSDSLLLSLLFGLLAPDLQFAII